MDERRTIFTQSVGTRIGPSTGFDQLIGTGLPMRLSRSAARVINRRLHTHAFRRNMTSGRLSFTAERTLTKDSGKSTIHFNSTFASKLSGPPPGGCGVGPSAVPPATQAPSPLDFNFPAIAGSTWQARTLFGTENYDGAIHLDWPPPGPGPEDSELQKPNMVLNASRPVITVFATDANQRAPVADLDFTGVNINKSYNASSGSYSFSGAKVKISPEAVLLLNARSCNVFTAGEEIGTLDADAQGH
jgi:hypothetical protein